MKVLLTGAGGFVGGGILRALHASGHEIFGLVREKKRELPEYVHQLIADLEEPGTLDFEISFDCIVNAAGLAHQSLGTEYSRFYDSNVRTASNLAQFAVQNGIKRFIQVSSISVYGSEGYAGRVIDETTEPKPDDFYGTSKLEAEKALVQRLTGRCELLILRPATVIGRGDKGNIASLIRAIRDRKFVSVGKGENKKSFVHVNDLGATVSALLETEKEFDGVLNVCSTVTTVSNLIEEVYRSLGRSGPFIRLPDSVVRTPIGIIQRVGKINAVDIVAKSFVKWTGEIAVSGRKSEIVFKPRIDLATAIKEEVDWIAKTK